MFNIETIKLLTQFQYNPEAPLIFNSGFFLFLFLGFLSVYTALSKRYRAKLTFVTLFSLYFYYKSSGMYFLILIGSTVVDYILANYIYRTPTYWKRLLLTTFSIVINLGLLGYFKYTNFVHEILSNLSGLTYKPFDIFLPVGVSFFTFQSLS